MSDNANRLLVVDDEPEIVDFVTTVAGRLGFNVAGIGSGAGFLQLVDNFQPSVIL